ncbi:acyl-[acyl-carrier-protein] thioesterase [Saccharibacillus alkalitolerans]|uniref:Acyl-ACP thioesterase n=1 Tax=Saccharibacillus alkalitolerans TaxID=2705290 RepID=A0ABX0FEF7_9BACL|nr:acyl-ACP thioesterase domain-containing protein [Saccharibacillus alkalitolerans]NGZ78162.1 acyl-ACP thioesterase [Saccharibacillus alkalitolerans]
MQEVWTESFAASVTESDFAGRVRLSALLGAMQNAADRHLEHAGVSVGRMLEEGMAWVLMTTRLEFSKIPRLGDPLSLETWNCGAAGVLWTRDYRILDASGEQLAQASTAWTLVDIAKRRILRPTAFPFPLPVSGRPSLAGPPEKVALPGEGAGWSEAQTYTVPYSAVDCYGHMNNARYADLCTDLLTPDELKTRDIRSFRITYSREAALGDGIALRRGADEEGRVLVSGESDGGRRTFEAVLELRPIDRTGNEESR